MVIGMSVGRRPPDAEHSKGPGGFVNAEALGIEERQFSRIGHVLVAGPREERNARAKPDERVAELARGANPEDGENGLQDREEDEGDQSGEEELLSNSLSRRAVSARRTCDVGWRVSGRADFQGEALHMAPSYRTAPASQIDATHYMATRYDR
jgi:hypothetical protein